MTIEFPGHQTIADLIENGTLDKPIDYVRGVLENMSPCRNRHGDAWVSIGMTGKGIAPNYRVAPDHNFVETLLADGDLSAYF